MPRTGTRQLTIVDPDLPPKDYPKSDSLSSEHRARQYAQAAIAHDWMLAGSIAEQALSDNPADRGRWEQRRARAAICHDHDESGFNGVDHVS